MSFLFSVGRYELKRPWVDCLQTNKLNWKEKAMKGRHVSSLKR